MNNNRGCTNCNETFESDEYVCPHCGSERVISVEEAFYMALEVYKKETINEIEELHEEFGIE